MENNKKFNLKLEQYVLGENSEPLILNDQDRIDINYIEEDNAEFFKKFNVSELSKETEKRYNKENKIVKFPVKLLTTLATAAACFIFAINILPNFNSMDNEIIYLKGSRELNIYLKNSDKIDKLKNLDKVFRNDQLQLTYKTKESFGVIFSVDGLNNITFHFPENNYESTRLEIGKEVNLPTSYTLDNAPFFEKFYMITKDESFDFNYIKDRITLIKVENGKIVKDLTLTKKYSIETVTLLKD